MHSRATVIHLMLIIGKSLVNGAVVATIEMPRTMAARISHEGLDVGCDRYSPVGRGYTVPFPFTATITEVSEDITAE